MNTLHRAAALFWRRIRNRQPHVAIRLVGARLNLKVN